MAVLLQTQQGHPGRSVIFTFDQEIAEFLVGISYWSFTYGEEDHHVSAIALAVDAKKLNDRQVEATIIAEMKDTGGHEMVHTKSVVVLSCVAVTPGNTQENVILCENSEVRADQPAACQVPEAFSGHAVLRGWSMTGKDLEVMRFITNAEVDNDESVKARAVVAGREGGGRTRHLSGTSDIGLISVKNDLNTPPILIEEVSSTETSIEMSQDVQSAVAMIRAQTIIYPKDDAHHVKLIGGGCQNGCTVTGSNVSFSATSFMSDDSKHKQSGLSVVRLCIIAVT